MASQVREFLFGFKVTHAIKLKRFPNLERFGGLAGKPNQTFLNADVFVKAILKPCESVRSSIGLLTFEFFRFWLSDYAHGPTTSSGKGIRKRGRLARPSSRKG
jgi:hypothetical protein